MVFVLAYILLGFMLLTLFFLISKSNKMNFLSSSVFECGFTSYFFSRFSFSMHYFLMGLIFLFLDLELCYLMPLMSQDFSSFFILSYLWLFILILLMGLMEEWKKGMLDWKF